MTTYHPPQCTEREPDGSWEDCLWASLVMLGNSAYADAHYPSTQHEYEALRHASGDSMVGGSNMDDGVKGMDARWGWHGRVTNPSLQGLNELKVGESIALGGNMRDVSSHLRRWDEDFMAGHTTHVVRDEKGYWWQNPQAPQAYQGEYVAIAELRAFAGGLPGARSMTVRVGQRKVPTWEAAAPAGHIFRYFLNDAKTAILPQPNGRKSIAVNAFKSDCTPRKSYLWTGEGVKVALVQLKELPYRGIYIADDYSNQP